MGNGSSASGSSLDDAPPSRAVSWATVNERATQNMSSFYSSNAPLGQRNHQRMSPKVQRTQQVENAVNLKRGTLCLKPVSSLDDPHDDSLSHYVSFRFDASTQCRVRVYSCALETVTGPNRTTFSSMAAAYSNRSCLNWDFPKGMDQTFGSGAEGETRFYFDAAEAMEFAPSEGSDTIDFSSPRHALVIVLESLNGSEETEAGNRQITYVNVYRDDTSDGTVNAKAGKQRIFISGQMFEVEEIFGLSDKAKKPPNVADEIPAESADCVVCLCEPRDTAILPCRHCCVCLECAEELRKNSNKCPICRGTVRAFLQIKKEAREEKVQQS